MASRCSSAVQKVVMSTYVGGPADWECWRMNDELIMP